MRLHHAGYGLREEQRNVVDGRIGDQIDGNYGVVLGVHVHRSGLQEVPSRLRTSAAIRTSLRTMMRSKSRRVLTIVSRSFSAICPVAPVSPGQIVGTLGIRSEALRVRQIM